MNCAKSGECFWKTSEAVDWIEETAVAISSHTIQIQLHFLNGVDCWLIEVIVRTVQSDGVAEEINCVFVDVVMFEYIFRRLRPNIHFIPCRRVVYINTLNILI